MPENKQQPAAEDLVFRAMERFWSYGFSATSMSSLVNKTGVSRKGIYGFFKGKDDLFKACLAMYNDKVVTPAFQQVESPKANLSSIENYFEQQISLAERLGFPGVGCLFGNTMTEIAPHDKAVRELVLAHNQRLEAGFLNALKGELKASPHRLNEQSLSNLASLIACTTQGIWSHSRTVKSAAELRTKVDALIQLIKSRIK